MITVHDQTLARDIYEVADDGVAHDLVVGAANRYDNKAYGADYDDVLVEMCEENLADAQRAALARLGHTQLTTGRTPEPGDEPEDGGPEEPDATPTTYVAIEGARPEWFTNGEAEEICAQVHSTVQEMTDQRCEGVAFVDDIVTETTAGV